MNNDEIQNAIEFLLKHQANFEVQLEKTNRQLEQTNQHVSVLAETQTEFIQTMLRHVEAQGEINADLRQWMRGLATAQETTDRQLFELATAQQQTQRDISELTKNVTVLAQHVYREQNPPPQT